MRRMPCLLAAVTFSLMAGTAAYAQTEIIVSYAFPSTNKAIMEEIDRQFEKAHPDIHIQLRNPGETYDDVVSDLLKSKITSSLPDVAYVGANHVGLMADRNIAVSLDTVTSSAGEIDRLGYYPAALTSGRVADHQYGIPFAISFLVLHVNVDLVEKAGGSMDKFPTTWEGITDLGKKISALDGKPVGFTFQYDTWGNFSLNSLVSTAGGRMEGPNGCGTGFATPEGRWAFNMLQMFHDKGMPAMTNGQVRQAFAAGSIGISAASGSSIVKNEEQAKGKFRYQTLPFPMKSENGKIPAGGTVVISTSQDKEKQKAAWEYIKFATGPEGQSIMVKRSGYAPVSEVAAETPDILGDYFKSHPNQAVQLAQLKSATDWHTWPGPDGIKVFSVIQDRVDAIVGGKETAEQTIPKVTKAVDAMLPACKTAQ